MQTTLKDLCSTFPKVSIQQSPLDNVATHVFNTDHTNGYIQSVHPPTERYGIPIDSGYLNHHNDLIPNFKKLGPNEQYLINKVLFSPSNLLYIIGGIGVGKTRFVHFLMAEILPVAISRNPKAKQYGACPIYYNFLEEGNTFPNLENSDAIRTAFLDSFCDRVEAELFSHEFFDLDFEVGTIWDQLIEQYKDEHNKHVALSFIIGELRQNEANHKHLALDYSTTIEKRKAIRQKILHDQNRRISYLALLLKYIRQNYFDADPAGLTLIIDNVDRETSLVQQIVKLILKPFSRVSGGRTIINARQSTYYQQLLDDGDSDPIDVVPYSGSTPYDVINIRIKEFLLNHSHYAAFYEPTHLPDLVGGVMYIQENFVISELFQLLFSSLSGRSVRKGLLLAQNIIHNSVYDPSTILHNIKTGGFDQPNIRVGEVLRAVMVGTDDIFRTTPNNRIDNLFEVASCPCMSYLIKLRILSLLTCADKTGVTIKRIIEIMNGFGYSLIAINDAINEMKNETKRLIWSDAVRSDFRDEEDLVNHGLSHLYISSAGLGYLNNLSTNIAYIQEVMLDTKVESEIFGSGWKYDILEDRFELVLKFLTLLSNADQEEVKLFMSILGDQAYKGYFCTTDMITKKIFVNVRESVEKILSTVISGQRRSEKRERFRDFKAKHLGIYEDRIITLQNFEYETFK